MRVRVQAFALMIVAAAFQALARNKMRSALTMLGVFIGVAALIAMVAVGQGANDAVRKQIESLGTNLLVVVAGRDYDGRVRSGQGSASTLTVVDAEALRREAPAVGSVSYLIRQMDRSSTPIRTGRPHSGRQRNYPPITNWQIAAGRAHCAGGRAEREPGRGDRPDGFRQLFGADENPIGAVIQVKSMPCV